MFVTRKQLADIYQQLDNLRSILHGLDAYYKQQVTELKQQAQNRDEDLVILNTRLNTLDWVLDSAKPKSKNKSANTRKKK